METLGIWLRQAREVKGSTVEEAEIVTRIKPRFLEALEAGDFSVFHGGEVQVRGFLRIYARYLDLSPDEVLARYDVEVHGAAASDVTRDTQSISSARPTTRPAPLQARHAFSSSAPRPPAMNLTTLAIVSLAIIVLLAVIVAGGYFFIRGRDEETAAAATATAPAAVETLPATPAASTQPSAIPTFAVNPDSGLTLALEASEHVWTRVTVDGIMVFEGRLTPGPTETWAGQEAITIDTGNGAGLLVTVNEQLQGAMCGRAEACSRTWGPDGEIIAP
jgi:cytoskeletal protein RodZ